MPGTNRLAGQDYDILGNMTSHSVIIEDQTEAQNLEYLDQGHIARIMTGSVATLATAWRYYDPDDSPNVIYSDVHGYLILSHLAGIPCVIIQQGSEAEVQRIDPLILLEVGTCPMILRRPSSNPGLNSILTHEIKDHGSLVCHKAGTVEPITLSIFKFLYFEGRNAVRKSSIPMLARLDIALREISSSADTDLSAFAYVALFQWVRPALSAQLPSH